MKHFTFTCHHWPFSETFSCEVSPWTPWRSWGPCSCQAGREWTSPPASVSCRCSPSPSAPPAWRAASRCKASVRASQAEPAGTLSRWEVARNYYRPRPLIYSRRCHWQQPGRWTRATGRRRSSRWWCWAGEYKDRLSSPQFLTNQTCGTCTLLPTNKYHVYIYIITWNYFRKDGRHRIISVFLW